MRPFLVISGMIFVLASCMNAPTSRNTSAVPTTMATAASTLVPYHPVTSPTCPSTSLQETPYLALPSVAGLPWLVADPPAAGVNGHLFYAHNNQPLTAGGIEPDGGTSKILWVIATTARSSTLTISGHEQTTAATYPAQDFPVTQGNQYPSILDFPGPGCWQISLMSGSVQAQVILYVVAPR